MTDNLAAAAADADRLDAALVERGILFAGKAMPVHLRPHFFTPTQRRRLETAAVAVLQAALAAEQGLFGGDRERLFTALRLHDAERRLLRLHPGYDNAVVWTRLDAFPTTNEVFFLEFNHDAPAGVGYSAAMTEIFLELPIVRRFAERYTLESDEPRPALLAALLSAYRDFGGVEHPTIGIVDWTDVRTSSDQIILRDYFTAQGYPAVIADPREVTLRRGRLYAGNVRLDIVYRRVVTSELLTKLDETRDFVTAYQTHAACFVNSFRCRVSENKAFFSFLTDPEQLAFLPEDARRTLLQHLPWTRIAAEQTVSLPDGRRVDLCEHVVRHRAEYVLKPADAYGGTNVYVGDETDEATWTNILRRAVRDDALWVVQRRVPTPVEVFPVRRADGGFDFTPMKYNANPFYLGGRIAGAVVRTSHNAVVNVSAGGGSIPTFTVTPRC
ncbi:MAG: circularly permuted type 2 ATP-grasp protein [Chloracidobacterium sp.]|nr:circularly permuted type 2 ATP-grasp protein [Chloracidobacterium sp.]MDW8217360.1 circularly permuted type 2 ATP-grasp protein [Acidobacteriota bacterium]